MSPRLARYHCARTPVDMDLDLDVCLGSRARRLYKVAALRHVITLTVSRGYVFQMEMMVRARALGYTVGEVPITFVDRLFGESKLGADEVVQYAKGVWALFTSV